VAARAEAPLDASTSRASPVSSPPRASWANQRGALRYVTACIAATRPKSLTAAVVPFVVGTSLASGAGAARWAHALPAFAAYVSMQIGCNLVNDACDFVRGADGPNRTGPTRVSQDGVFRASTVHLVGVACLVLATALMIPAALDLEYDVSAHAYGYGYAAETTNRIRRASSRSGAAKDARGCPVDVQWAVVILTVASSSAAYLYTGGPYPLGYHGLGDGTVIMFFGIVAVSLMRRVHVGASLDDFSGGPRDGAAARWDDADFSSLSSFSAFVRAVAALFPWNVVVAGAQTGATACVLLAVNNVRDFETDARAKKKTLAVLYGVEFVKREINVLLMMSYVLSAYWWFEANGVGVLTASRAFGSRMRPSYAAILPWLTLPRALAISRRTKTHAHPGSPECNAILAKAALLHLSFGVSLAIGIRWDAKANASS